MADLFASINTVALVLFIVGMVLLLIEMFTPGLGIFGGLGLLCLVLCIAFQAQSLTQALLLVLIIGAIVTLLALVLARSFKKGRLYRSGIVLKNEQTAEEGFVAGSNMSRLVGMQGVSVTMLRPAGIADFSGEKVDVLTDGDFIPADTPIEVIRTAGVRVFVKRMGNE